MAYVGEVVNIDTPSWAPAQVARELTHMIDNDEIKAVMVAVEYNEDAIEEHGHVFNWIGSKQTFNERVYLITWFYHRTIQRIFGGV